MKKAALVLIALTAALHFYIAWFEMFAWTTRGPVVFDTFPQDLFEKTIQLAANQGLYNAFLAVGLTWSLFIKDAKWQFNIAMCFLAFVAIAGIGAGITVAVKSGIPQFTLASIALVFLFLGRDTKTSS
jgi:putative membrane protein